MKLGEYQCKFFQLHKTKLQVPYRLKKAFNKIQQRLVRELEKKFSGKDVVLIANRRIMPPTKGASNKRPRSRTLTSVRNPPHPPSSTHPYPSWRTSYGER